MTGRNTKLVRDLKILKAYETQGKTIKEMAVAWDISPRSVDNALNRARAARAKSSGNLAGTGTISERSKLRDEQKRMLEWTSDGYERFFNAYSGKTLNPIHKRWVQEALDHDFLLINVPPRHAKSTIFAVWFPLWILCGANATQSEELRDAQVLVVSQTDDLAKKFARDIEWHLSSDKKLLNDFGAFKPDSGNWPWREGELLLAGRHREVLSGDLSFMIRGARQAILGMEADYIIIDDPVSPHTVWSETERERLNDWMHEQVLTRLQPEGRAICIGQRLHAQDLYGELAKEEHDDGRSIWFHINFPAVLDWDKEVVLWPEEWPFKAIKKRRAVVGEKTFSAMFQQQPISEAMAIAKPGWLYGDINHTGCVDPQRPAGQGPKDSADATVPWVRVFSVDPGQVQNWGLILADVKRASVDEYTDISIIETIRQQMSVRDFLAEAHRIVDNYHPEYCIVEENAGRHLLQDPDWEWFKGRLSLLRHNTGRNKGDERLGLESLAVDFEYGKIRCPFGDAEGRSMTEMLFEEARAYPQGKTDDLLMALWFIKWNLIRLVPKSFLAAAKPTWNIPPRLQKGWGWMQPKKGVT